MYWFRRVPAVVRFALVIALGIVLAAVLVSQSVTQARATGLTRLQNATPTPGPGTACTQESIDQLRMAVSQSWTGGQPSPDTVATLNAATLGCYSSGADTTGCDVTALSALQIALINAQASGQGLTDDAAQSLLDTLATCYGSGDVSARAPTVTPVPPDACDAAKLIVLAKQANQDWSDGGQIPYGTLEALDQAMSACSSTVSQASCDSNALRAFDQTTQQSGNTGAPLTSADDLRSLDSALTSCFGLSAESIAPETACSADDTLARLQSYALKLSDGTITPDGLVALINDNLSCFMAHAASCDLRVLAQAQLGYALAYVGGASISADSLAPYAKALAVCYGANAPSSAVMGGSGSGGSTGGAGSGAGGGNGGGSGGSGGGDGGAGSSQPGGPEAATGPYIVEKIMNLGGELPQGQVCATNLPFTVTMQTPKITFAIQFTPTGDSQGSWTYSYSFPDLGESHQASGTYTISAPAPDGKRQLSISGSDHVVFNGFDGRMPMNYRMGLTPSALPMCGGN